MTRTPRSASESAGVNYVGELARAWALIEPMQQWVDAAPGGPRPPEELVQDFLQREDPYPAGTAVFAARWRPGQWGVAVIIARVDDDEWAVEFLDHWEIVFRDHVELCPALWTAG
ncbi:hypothetical protein [Promicromonospora sp. NPDC050249]|uniref:hypothetical protein n=1 Tax=Promicromonospora sp. NPDC050249 TaxID=3154743 RepID=UPI003409FFAA